MVFVFNATKRTGGLQILFGSVLTTAMCAGYLQKLVKSVFNIVKRSERLHNHLVSVCTTAKQVGRL